MLKYIKIGVGMLMPLLLTYCVQNEYHESNNFAVDTLTINLSGNLLSRYYNFSVSTYEGTDFFVGYNHLMHQFDIFDLSNRQFLRSYTLASDGPHYVQNVSSYRYFSDTVISKNIKDLTVINSNSQIVQRIRQDILLADLDEKLTFAYGVVDGKFEYPGIDIENRAIYLPVFNYIQKGRKGSYPEPFIARIDLNDSSIELIEEIHYPASIRENFYSSLEYPRLHFCDPYLLISFQYTPEALVFNTETNQIRQPRFAASRFNKLANPISHNINEDNQSSFEYTNTSVQYYPLCYNEKSGLFSRVIKGPTLAEDGYFAWDNNYLCIYSESGKILTEWHLPSSYDPVLLDGAIGYYFQILPDNESQLRIARVRPLLPGNKVD